MTINTKYNIGDYVHFMYQNKVYSGEIYSVECRTSANCPLEIKYDIAGVNIPKLYEHKAFSSREELIKSL